MSLPIINHDGCETRPYPAHSAHREFLGQRVDSLAHPYLAVVGQKDSRCEETTVLALQGRQQGLADQGGGVACFAGEPLEFCAVLTGELPKRTPLPPVPDDDLQILDRMHRVPKQPLRDRHGAATTPPDARLGHRAGRPSSISVFPGFEGTWMIVPKAGLARGWRRPDGPTN